MKLLLTLLLFLSLQASETYQDLYGSQEHKMYNYSEDRMASVTFIGDKASVYDITTGITTLETITSLSNNGMQTIYDEELFLYEWY
jgi:hypothetical protein